MNAPARVALVTGAASGIGQATAHRLARLGLQVAVVDLNPEGQQTARAIVDNGGSATFYSCDVSDPAAVEECVSAVVADSSRLDVLVNCAGITFSGTVESTSPAEWDRVQNINLKGCFLFMRQAVPHLRKQPGSSVINISSFHAGTTEPANSAYAASKAGLLALTRSSALELAGEGVRVNAVCPGVIDTAQFRGWLVTNADQPSALRAVNALQPLGRIGQAEEVAAAVAFLASDDASYITGTTLFVDGGVSARLALVSATTQG